MNDGFGSRPTPPKSIDQVPTAKDPSCTSTKLVIPLPQLDYILRSTYAFTTKQPLASTRGLTVAFGVHMQQRCLATRATESTDRDGCVIDKGKVRRLAEVLVQC